MRGCNAPTPKGRSSDCRARPTQPACEWAYFGAKREAFAFSHFPLWHISAYIRGVPGCPFGLRRAWAYDCLDAGGTTAPRSDCEASPAVPPRAGRSERGTAYDHVV